MVTITNIRNIDYAAFDEVWAIVRSLKNSGRMKHVPALSPSWNLFKQYLVLRNVGQWNKAAFDKIYVPVFLKEMQSPAAQRKLAELMELDRQGKRICLACFCSDEATCHRSIIAVCRRSGARCKKRLFKLRKRNFALKRRGLPCLCLCSFSV